MDPHLSELIRDVNDFCERLAGMGPDEILEVDENSDPAQIRRSYYRLVKKFHPDRIYDSADHELKSKISTLFDAITKAYKLLQDDEKRQKYFISITRTSRRRAPWEKRLSDEPSAEDARVVTLKEQFRQGKEEFAQGNFWGAVEKFRWVTKEEPGNAKAWSYLSLSLSNVPNRMKEAEEALLQAIRLEPRNPRHLTGLGSLYLKIGLKMRARRQFEKALSLDPQDTGAQAGLEQTR